jgi:hypothetical protein
MILFYVLEMSVQYYNFWNTGTEQQFAVMTQLYNFRVHEVYSNLCLSKEFAGKYKYRWVQNFMHLLPGRSEN